tara:strand:- start:168 stop:593 length:426 start_codon:yes stop_codon:yes gene_type:complete
MKLKLFISGIILFLTFVSYAENNRSLSSAGAQLYFISPSDGEVLKSPFKVRFGLSNMGVAPAGVDVKNTGHHHLLIDAQKLPELDKALPSDEVHIHYGGGQTESILNLVQGKHSLQLILGDKYHIPHNPPVISKKIFITIK